MKIHALRYLHLGLCVFWLMVNACMLKIHLTSLKPQTSHCILSYSAPLKHGSKGFAKGQGEGEGKGKGKGSQDPEIHDKASRRHSMEAASNLDEFDVPRLPGDLGHESGIHSTVLPRNSSTHQCVWRTKRHCDSGGCHSEPSASTWSMLLCAWYTTPASGFTLIYAGMPADHVAMSCRWTRACPDCFNEMLCVLIELAKFIFSIWV